MKKIEKFDELSKEEGLAEEEKTKCRVKVEEYFKLAEEESPRENVDSHIRCLLEYAGAYAKEVGKTFSSSFLQEQFGITNEKIKSLLIQGYESGVKKWFKLAEEEAPKGYVDSHIRCLQQNAEKYAKEVGKTFSPSFLQEQFGITNEKIESLLIQGYKSEFKKWFKLAEEEASEEYHRNNCIKCLQQYLEKLKEKLETFSLEGLCQELGLDEKKVKELLKEEK